MTYLVYSSRYDGDGDGDGDGDDDDGLFMDRSIRPLKGNLWVIWK